MIYDLVVIGAGIAGTHAALTARQHGLKTLLAESGFFGGACLNSGCIPTKFLLGSTASSTLLDIQKKFKCADGTITFDLAAIQERKKRYIKGMRSAVEKRLQAAGVELRYGRASFISPNSISIKTKDGLEDIQFKTCIIATGSIPAAFSGLEPDGKNVLSSSGILGLDKTPESLVIIGGGVIGLELGDFYSRLGTKITMIEAAERIALSEDAEVSSALHKHLSRSGWDIRVNCKVTSVHSTDSGIILRLADGNEIIAEKAMIAVGRHPNCKQLAPEAAGISCTGPGWITTDEYLLAAPNIYAVGDINKKLLLAHAAEDQADYALRHALGLEQSPYAAEAVPSCIYGSTELMHVGPSSDALVKKYKTKGHKVAVSKAPFIANAIAQSYGTTHGWVKITWVDNRVHSIAAWGHGVSHLVSIATVMVQEHWDANKIIFAHPTLDEALKSAFFSDKESL